MQKGKKQGIGLESNMVGDDDVFTVPELANYLRMKPITIYKHVASGKLPGFKVGSQWRFKKKTIDSWIAKQEDKNISRLNPKKN